MQIFALNCINGAFLTGFGAFCGFSGVLRVAEMYAFIARIWVGVCRVYVHDTPESIAVLILRSVDCRENGVCRSVEVGISHDWRR